LHCRTPTARRLVASWTGECRKERLRARWRGAQGALVEIVIAIHAALRAERFVAGEAVFALHAAGVMVAPVDVVAFGERYDIAADILHGN